MQYRDNQLKEVGKKMRPCPKSPNCVSSLDRDRRHGIEAIAYTGSIGNARERLLNILNETDRVQVVSSRSNFIWAESTSFLFRFVDNVEFFFDDRMKIIHVKSQAIFT